MKVLTGLVLVMVAVMSRDVIEAALPFVVKTSGDTQFTVSIASTVVLYIAFYETCLSVCLSVYLPVYVFFTHQKSQIHDMATLAQLKT